MEVKQSEGELPIKMGEVAIVIRHYTIPENIVLDLILLLNKIIGEMLGLSANLNYYLFNANVDLWKDTFCVCESKGRYVTR